MGRPAEPISPVRPLFGESSRAPRAVPLLHISRPPRVAARSLFREEEPRQNREKERPAPETAVQEVVVHGEDGSGEPGRGGEQACAHENESESVREPVAPVAETVLHLPSEGTRPEPVAEALVALAQARAEAEELRDRYINAIAELGRVESSDLSTLENDLVDLAIEVAREIILREVQTDPSYVERLVEAALRVVLEDEAATVLVAPADQERLEKGRPRLEVARGGGLLRVAADPSLHPGECIVQVGRARVDARLSDRLEQLRKALHSVDTEIE